MPRTIALVRTSIALGCALTIGLAAPASSASSITDPTGDFVAGAPCGGLGCEPWQDITSAEISHTPTGLHLTMTLNASLPNPPAISPAIKQLVWAWRLDTQTPGSPAGYPLPNGVESPFEVLVMLGWNGTSYFGQLVDRRPLVSGGEAIVTAATVNVLGNVLTADLLAGTPALPAGFNWRASTNTFTGVQGSLGQFAVDNTAFSVLEP